MKKQFVYDPLISKRQQYLLATQVRFFSRFFASSSQAQSANSPAGSRCTQNRLVQFFPSTVNIMC